MKIHNYSSDYAYQQKKALENEPKVAEPVKEPVKEPEVKVEPEPKEEAVDAGNQVQEGGEAGVAEPQGTEKTPTEEPEKEPKNQEDKKKKK